MGNGTKLEVSSHKDHLLFGLQFTCKFERGLEPWALEIGTAVGLVAPTQNDERPTSLESVLLAVESARAAYDPSPAQRDLEGRPETAAREESGNEDNDT
jgi:hypothetical protein